MGLRSLIAALSLVAVSALALQGCSKDAQKVQPETRGKRGESCLARNDCDTGLACISGICAKNEFNIDVAAKQCVRVDCEVTDDCCGDKPTSAPKKCEGRDQVCDPANRLVTGCTTTTCTDATEASLCGDGTCGMGTCSGGGTSGPCATAADCKKDTCNVGTGICTVSGVTCTADVDCFYFGATLQCLNRICNCQNPLYDPSDPICTDPDCEDVCLLRCEDSLCVADTSCKTDAQCLAAGSKICDGGRCVQCTRDSECDEKNDETCESGVCHKPCKQNEECPLLYECKKGDCVYSGCHDDRECILGASRGGAGVGGGPAVPEGSSADDPRLYKCLPNEADPDHKTCKVPCENDASCGKFQVCDQGYCKFVGCDTNEQCRDYLGIANQQTSDSKPYVSTAKCEAPTTSKTK